MPERGDASYENNGKERKDQTESGCRGGGLGGWGGAQTESCGRLKKKLEVAAGSFLYRAIRNIDGSDRKD